MYNSKFQDCFFNIKTSKKSFDLLKKNMRNVDSLDIEIGKYRGDLKNNLERMLYDIDTFKRAINHPDAEHLKSILQKVAEDVYNNNYSKGASEFAQEYEKKFGYSTVFYSNID